jgi:hypothetical protein
MRTVSPCACARVQSRLIIAAVAAVSFSSVLRETGMALSSKTDIVVFAIVLVF